MLLFFVKEKTIEVSKKSSKEKKSKSKDVEQVPNGLTKVNDKKKSDGKAEMKKMLPAKQSSDSVSGACMFTGRCLNFLNFCQNSSNSFKMWLFSLIDIIVDWFTCSYYNLKCCQLSAGLEIIF